jgi:hypothetical protein
VDDAAASVEDDGDEVEEPMPQPDFGNDLAKTTPSKQGK